MQEGVSSFVEVPDMTVDGLKLFLLLFYIQGHVYGDSIEEEDTAPLLFGDAINHYFDELFDACIKYQVKVLEPTIIAYIGRNLTVHNCHMYWKKCAAMTHSADGMYIVFTFIGDNTAWDSDHHSEGMDSTEGNLHAYIDRRGDDRGLPPQTNVLVYHPRR